MGKKDTPGVLVIWLTLVRMHSENMLWHMVSIMALRPFGNYTKCITNTKGLSIRLLWPYSNLGVRYNLCEIMNVKWVDQDN